MPGDVFLKAVSADDVAAIHGKCMLEPSVCGSGQGTPVPCVAVCRTSYYTNLHTDEGHDVSAMLVPALVHEVGVFSQDAVWKMAAMVLSSLLPGDVFLKAVSADVAAAIHGKCMLEPRVCGSGQGSPVPCVAVCRTSYYTNLHTDEGHDVPAMLVPALVHEVGVFFKDAVWKMAAMVLPSLLVTATRQRNK